MRIEIFEALSLSIYNVLMIYLLAGLVVVCIRERFQDKHRMQRALYNIGIWFIDALVIILLNGGEAATVQMLLPVIRFFN